METSSSGTVRGIGAGIRTIGAPLAENIGKEIATKGLTKNALSTGFKNTFNFKGAAGAGFGMGAAGEVLNAIGGPKREYSGYASSLIGPWIQQLKSYKGHWNTWRKTI